MKWCFACVFPKCMGPNGRPCGPWSPTPHCPLPLFLLPLNVQAVWLIVSLAQPFDEKVLRKVKSIKKMLNPEQSIFGK